MKSRILPSIICTARTMTSMRKVGPNGRPPWYPHGANPSSHGYSWISRPPRGMLMTVRSSSILPHPAATGPSYFPMLHSVGSHGRERGGDRARRPRRLSPWKYVTPSRTVFCAMIGKGFAPHRFGTLTCYPSSEDPAVVTEQDVQLLWTYIRLLAWLS